MRDPLALHPDEGIDLLLDLLESDGGNDLDRSRTVTISDRATDDTAVFGPFPDVEIGLRDRPVLPTRRAEHRRWTWATVPAGEGARRAGGWLRRRPGHQVATADPDGNGICAQLPDDDGGCLRSS